MVKILIKLILSYVLILNSYQEVKAQPIVGHVEVQGQKLLYRVTLPDGYDQTKAYPVLFAPGFEKTTDGNSIYLGNSPSKHGWIIVESIVHMKSEIFTQAIINQIRNNYRTENVYLSGFSANSVDIFRRAAKFVELIDGVIAMPGYANQIDSRVIARNPDITILLIVGEEDNYWKNRSVKAYQRLQALGAIVSLDIIPKQGHIMEDFAGDPFFNLLAERLDIIVD